MAVHGLSEQQEKNCACWRLDMHQGMQIVLLWASVNGDIEPSTRMHFATEWQTHQTYLSMKE